MKEKSNLEKIIRKDYKTPIIEVIKVEMQQNILSGSAGDDYPIEPMWN